MLVGRHDELGVVRTCVDEARPIVLVGPAGIGKSSLARAALGGQGSFREGGALASLTWSPFLVFRRLLQAAPTELPEGVAGAVLHQGDSPVLLDDLQWADDASLDAVGLLVGRLPVVATVRSGEERSEAVLAALEAVGAERLDVPALAPGPAAQLARMLHPDLDGAERARLVELAAGNPLLLGELPKGPEAAPTLVSVLVARVAELDPDARTAMERLAVLGRPAGPAELGPGADGLVEAGLAEPVDGRFVVRHALLGEVIADELGPRIDEVRRDLVPLVDPPESAHLLEALGDRPAARAVALAAAEAETDRRRRAALLVLAVRCAPDLDVENRVAAARLLCEISDPATARALCDIPGRDDLDPVSRGALYGAEGAAAWGQGRAEETARLLEHGLADLTGTGTAYEAALLAGSTVIQTFVDLDGRPVLERARAAVRLADELGVEWGYTRARLASVLLTSGEPGWAELYAEVIERAEAEGDLHLRRTAVTSVVLGRWVTGDAVGAEAVARRDLGDAPPDAFDVHWLSVASYAGILGLLAGRPRGELVDEFGPLLDRWPWFRTRPFLESAVILALADAGRHVEAAERGRGAVERAGFEAQSRSLARWAQAEAAWLAGRPADAVAEVERLVALGIGDYPSAVQARLVAAHAARELGVDPVGATPAVAFPAWRAAPLEWEALAAAREGRVDDAVAGLLEAAEGWVGSDVRRETRCRWAAGDVAAAAGRADAADLLARAEDQAAALGLVALQSRIRRSLRTIGVSRRADRGDRSDRADRGEGRVGLTGREVEVLELVEAGLRSADIAAALGVEPSTVESFVRSAMRKLGVRTRLAAAARWRELSAADPTG